MPAPALRQLKAVALAQHLPQPLYTLFYQLAVYRDAFGTSLSLSFRRCVFLI
jgi:hypothetical protein